MDRLREYFIKDRMAATLLFIIFIILGAVSLYNLPIRMMRAVKTPFVRVEIPAPGYTNKDVDVLVKDAESKLKNLSRLNYLRAYSFKNHGQLILNYQVGTNLQEAKTLVKDRLASLKLPAGTGPLTIHSASNVLTVSKLLVYGPSTAKGVKYLTKKLEKKLEQLNVGKIETAGLSTHEWVGEISPHQLYQMQTSYNALADQLRSNIKKQPIGVSGRDQTEQSIISAPKNSATPGELTVYLGRHQQAYIFKDIADLKEVVSYDGVKVTYKGKPAAIISVIEDTGNGMSMPVAGQKVLNWLNEANTQAAGAYRLVPFDQKWLVMKSNINNLVLSVVESIIVITFILMIFISWNITFWIVAGMITCVLGTFGIYGFTGGASLNMISIFAIILAIGIVVDDSIVVGEESFHLWKRLGFDPLKANMAASRKPSLIAAGLTTIVAFVPLFTTPGNVGVLFRDIPLIMIIIIIVSVIECLFVMPHHLYKAYSKSTDREGNKVEQWVRMKCSFMGKGFGRFSQNYYKKVLEKSIDYRWICIVLVIMTTACCFGLLLNKHIKIDLMDNPLGNALTVKVTMRTSYQAGDINAVQAEMDKSLRTALKDSGLVSSTVLLIPRITAKQIDYRVQFPMSAAGKINYYDFIDHWKKTIVLPESVKSISMMVAPVIRIRKSSADVALYNTDPAHDTYENLAAASNKVMAFLQTVEGVLEATNKIKPTANNIELSLNAHAQQLGLSAADVSRQLQSGLYGTKVTTLQEGTAAERDFILKMPARYRDNIDTLLMTPIQTPSHSMVTLGTIARIKEVPGYEVLARSNYEKADIIRVHLNAHVLAPSELITLLQDHLGKVLGTTYHVKMVQAGSLAQASSVFASLQRNLMIAIVLIYFILVFVFKSWIYPLLVLPVIPIALGGAIFGLWILGINFSAAAFFGLFGLAGVVVNDAIILIMCFRILVNKEGMTYTDAIKHAVFSRSRAILLTSITTIVALIPAILNAPSKSDFLLPLAVSMVFGMAVVTLLLLFFVPALLSVYIDFKFSVLKWLGRDTSGCNL
ncbi:MAG: hypothetical protein COB66_08525 [Coxiella sp. (in: Bacteria)]|nr:MAG: hypothetical protein COB66_08525 [Coxiella sp. (in: g-proteobacteria)]